MGDSSFMQESYGCQQLLNYLSDQSFMLLATYLPIFFTLLVEVSKESATSNELHHKIMKVRFVVEIDHFGDVRLLRDLHQIFK